MIVVLCVELFITSCLILYTETEGGDSGTINATEKIDPEKIEDGGVEGEEKKKKKKKNKSKSGKGPSKEQTTPPTIPIAELYPDGKENKQMSVFN